jgi:hypothetical protein
VVWCPVSPSSPWPYTTNKFEGVSYTFPSQRRDIGIFGHPFVKQCQSLEASGHLSKRPSSEGIGFSLYSHACLDMWAPSKFVGDLMWHKCKSHVYTSKFRVSYLVLQVIHFASEFSCKGRQSRHFGALYVVCMQSHLDNMVYTMSGRKLTIHTHYSIGESQVHQHPNMLTPFNMCSNFSGVPPCLGACDPLWLQEASLLVVGEVVVVLKT